MQQVAVAAPDKFRSTLTAAEAAGAIAAGARRAGWSCTELPLADGGEGTLAVLGGGNRRTRVTGPLGEPVDAAWRFDDGYALIEAAQACGLSLAGGRELNDPLRATSRGVGELVVAALAAGAERIVVAAGGTASTDGGLGAVEELLPLYPLPARLEVACDVEVRFTDAVAIFAPQKGATPEHVRLLRGRLDALAERYRAELGADVRLLAGSGAAGGLAGGLAAVGADLVPGFEFVAGRLELDLHLAEADLVVTGEGLLDATSAAGKVVGGVVERARRAGVGALVVAGEVAADSRIEAVSLVARCGRERALAEPRACLEETIAAALAGIPNGA